MEGKKEAMHPGFWWILPCVGLELIATMAVVHRLTFRGRDLHKDVDPLQTCGTIFDSSTSDPTHSQQNEDEQEAQCKRNIPFKRKLLAFWRTCVFIWSTFVVVYDLHGSVWETIRFFTCWNFILQTVFWGLAACSCLLHISGYSPPERLLKLTNLLHAICLPMSILVSLVYWGALVPNDIQHGDKDQIAKDLSWSMYAQHAFNTVFILLDFGVNRYLVHEHHLFPILVWTSLYCVFVWSQHVVTQEWPYFFMAIKPVALLWYSGILILHVILFQVAYLISRVKRKYVGEVDLIYRGTIEPLLHQT